MKFLLGIDFGTLSCRAALIDETGALVATEAMDYPHGCITAPDGGVYQQPQDYLDSLAHTVRRVTRGREEQVAALCVDFTACTVLPVDRALQPLGLAHLWKSHSAQAQAEEVEAVCRQKGISLAPYGDSVSPEWLFPKLLQLKQTQPETYEAAAWYLEAGDWVTWLLGGRRVRSCSNAAGKGLWQKGWPMALVEALELRPQLLEGELLPPGATVGTLTPMGCELLGLSPTTVVTAPLIDAYAALPAAGIRGDGEMMLILGTSGCDLLLSRKSVDVPGVYGRFADVLLPGYTLYEAGTPCLGDLFGWFMHNCVSGQLAREADGDVFGHLEQLAAQSGSDTVWAIDWWNGSRTPYLDATLTGCLFGLTLRTRPEHIYRALLEAAAFNTRQLFDRLEEAGVPVHRVVAGGGIPQKNKLYMQILADVLEREVFVCDNEPACAIGAAILAAWGGGLYPGAEEAVQALGKAPTCSYRPGEDYTQKYRRYVQMADRLAK